MQNNPLRQFFRRPSVYFKLPSGGKDYEPGTLDIPENGELPVYPMTAIDEISVRTPDALFNGSALVDLIKSCVPNIKDPWKLNSNDLDAVLIAIRAAGGNQTLEIETTCPKCENVATFGLNLVSVLSTLKYGDYDTVLEVNDIKLKFRPLTYKEMNEASNMQFNVQKQYATIESIEDVEEKTKATYDGLKQITELTMSILSKTIEYIETPNSRVDNKEFILDFLHNCDGSIFVAIRDHNAKLKMTTELKPLDIKCANCSHEYQQPYVLNPADFFV
jgi:T4 bacteriophage base plate protein